MGPHNHWPPTLQAQLKKREKRNSSVTEKNERCFISLVTLYGREEKKLLSGQKLNMNKIIQQTVLKQRNN